MSTPWSRWALLAAGLALGGTVVTSRQPQRIQPARENAYRANNLGVALLEQYSYDQAVASFRSAFQADSDLHIARLNLAIAQLYSGAADQALDTARAAARLLPDLPQPPYIVGLAAKAQGLSEDAIAAFRRVLQIDPEDVGSRVNLGQTYVQQRQYAEAAALFRQALDREPYNATAAYGLAMALTRSGATDAAAAMRRFEALRDAPYAVTYSSTYLEQGRYGEAIASTGAEPDLVDPSPPRVTFADSTATTLPGAVGLGRSGESASGSGGAGSVTLFDVDGDGDLDAFVTAPSGQHLYTNSSGTFSDATTRAGLSNVGPATGALAADYDNDGRNDLLLLGAATTRLLRQGAGGRFDEVGTAAGFSAAGGAASGAFVDVDHDGDLDVLIAGSAGRNQLIRNNGDGTFSDITAAAGIAGLGVQAIALAPTDFDNHRDVDLLFVASGRAPLLFQNMRDGSFRDVAPQVGLTTSAAYSALAAADVNKDGYADFFFARSGGPGVFAVNDGHDHFTTIAAPIETADAVVAQFIDYDNDGLLDLFTASRSGARLFRNIGGRWSDLTARAGLPPSTGTWTVRSAGFGDLDGDGDLDALLVSASGELRSWRNDGGDANHTLRVRLTGRASNRGGVGSKIDLRAGSLRQRVETSAASPALRPADVLFGLGQRTSADVVRVIWPSGTLQAELVGDSRVAAITELNRKPSSCPYLYTWSGQRFEFVTDFMGGGEIGYWEEPGVWNTPDPDEYVRIPPGQLVARDGRYELRVTNELEEAVFIDRLQLVALDHPSDSDVFPNEGLGAPGSGRFSPATTRGARPPVAARDGHGHDVLPQLMRLDRQYSDDFTVADIPGYAEPHELRLDVGPSGRDVVLLMTGWTDYAFSKDNVAAHQRGMRLVPPSLQVKSSSGNWRPVIENIGVPVGRPQTVVVDVRGKLRAGEHELRILTNMRIYWDRILVDTSGGGVPLRVRRLDPAVAQLRWRGFSAEVTPDGREPFGYDYDRVSQDSMWKTMEGRYTREGDVRELLRMRDDMFVIARPGDEIVLSFDARLLEPLPPGQSRTFMLYADGFSKEMDITSASPHTVAPLPFHAMTRYPYGPDEHYPTTAAHREYLRRFNTRIVRRSIPSIEMVAGR